MRHVPAMNLKDCLQCIVLKTCVPEKVQGAMKLKNNNKKLCHQGYIMMTTRPDN